MRKSVSTLDVMDGAKKLPKQTFYLTVTAVEKSMGLDRDLRVQVKGQFDYVKMASEDSGISFNITMEEMLGMPSMCLIDTESAIEYAATLGDKLAIHFTAKGAADPKVVVKNSSD